MRLIGTLKNVDTARKLSQALTKQGIDNQCEEGSVTDWGSPEYGDRFARIWIVDEDRLEQAMRLYQSYEESAQSLLPPPDISPSSPSKAPPLLANLKHRMEDAQQNAVRAPAQQAMGPVTLALIFVCALLYFWTVFDTPAKEKVPEGMPRAAVSTSPVLRAMLYDYPKAFEIVDEFAALVQKNQWTSDSQISAEGQALISQFESTPFWHGIYAVVVEYFRHGPWEQALQAPMFEKIRVGEFWRVITPVFLHSDLLHILFNMLWLIVLGKQLEQRLGVWRYLLFCLIVGVFSNTVQYLTGGPNFIGFSGILCGMLAYIWVRQRKAPWEGYQLQNGTYLFLSVFVLAMLGLQIASFVGEVYLDRGIASGIANAAHLSGALAGYVLGQLPLFAWHRQKA